MGLKEKSKQKNRTRYSVEFRKEAARLVIEENQDINEVAVKLGVDLVNLKRWVQDSYKCKYDKDYESLQSTLKKMKLLEEENKKLKMERDFLKKAAAYFAKPQE